MRFEPQIIDQVEKKALEIFDDGAEEWRVRLEEHGVSEFGVKRIIGDTQVAWESAVTNLCESPIEQIMLSALLWGDYGYRREPVDVYDPTMPFPMRDTDIVVAPQFEVGKYRLDFAVFARNFSGEKTHFGIECDGHNFHEKTKEQAKRDKARDRTLLTEGWPVFRFTGSEIWNQSGECVSEVSEFVQRWIEEDLERRGVLSINPSAA